MYLKMRLPFPFFCIIMSNKLTNVIELVQYSINLVHMMSQINYPHEALGSQNN